ncbi:MAG: DUF5723 family protein, partial [Bacteroidota bacterium]
MTIKNPFFLFLLSLWSLGLSAQQEIGLHFDRTLWQSSRTQPALVPDNQLTIMLPSMYFDVVTENFSIQDALSMSDDGTTTLNIGRIIDQLGTNNEIGQQLSIQTLGVAYRFGKWTLSLEHGLRQYGSGNYPKTLPQLIWEGNGQFVGQTVDLSHQFDITAYHEFVLGAAWELSDQWHIGTRIKLLNGIANTQTERGGLSLFTSDDVFQIRLTGDYLVHTAGVLGIDDLSILDQTLNFNGVDDAGIFSKNMGWAVDLGVAWESEKWTLAASVLDIGRINWKEEVSNYSFEGTVEYNGLDIIRDYAEGQVGFSDVLDTLDATFAPTRSELSYQTVLPRQFYLTGTYACTDKMTLGGLWSGRVTDEGWTPTIAANVRYQLSDQWSVGGNYAIIGNTYDNIGLS